MFTVPPGGDGVYYFSTYLLVDRRQFGHFNIQLNGTNICAIENQNLDSSTYGSASCNAVVRLTAGDKINVFYFQGTSLTLLKERLPIYPVHGFSGFRI